MMRDAVLVQTIHDETVIVAREDYANPALSTLDLCTAKGVPLKQTATAACGEMLQISRTTIRCALPSVAGHQVVKRETSDKIPYELLGPKGAAYLLLRNEKDPHLLFAVNKNKMKTAKVYGYEWFSDATGEILPMANSADQKRHDAAVARLRASS
jgi:hypothetical protein